MRLPWWSLVGAKLLLSRVPLGYAAWRRLRLFVHGDMANPDYALDVVAAHLEMLGLSSVKGMTLLELGPGDSIGTGVIAHGLGCRKSILVDVGAFSKRNVEIYRELADKAAARGLFALNLTAIDTWDDLVDVCSIDYKTNGLESLRKLSAESVEVSFSQAVLEHVRLREVLETLKELYRVTKVGGMTSHRIDLRDHLGGGLNHLRFSEHAWEREWFAGAGFYTNRIRASEWLRLFSEVGWEVRSATRTRWKSLPIPRTAIDRAFIGGDADDLRTWALNVTAFRR